MRRYTRQEIISLLEKYNDYLAKQPEGNGIVQPLDRWLLQEEVSEEGLCKSIKVKDWVKVKSKESDDWMLRQIAEVPKPGKPIWCFDLVLNVKIKYNIFQLKDGNYKGE